MFLRLQRGACCCTCIYASVWKNTDINIFFLLYYAATSIVAKNRGCQIQAIVQKAIYTQHWYIRIINCYIFIGLGPICAYKYHVLSVGSSAPYHLTTVSTYLFVRKFPLLPSFQRKKVTCIGSCCICLLEKYIYICILRHFFRIEDAE